MHTRALLAVVLSVVVIPCVPAQSVTVTSKKVVYRRSEGNDLDFKRTFEVNYPIFRGGVSAAVRRRLKIATDYWKVFDMSLTDNLKGDENWLSSFDYEVKYNRNSLLAIWLTAEGVGAYPDGSTIYLVIDLRNGNKVELADVFQTAQLTTLRNLIRRKMKVTENALDNDSRSMLKEYRQNEPEFYPPPEKLELKKLEGFSISDRGVTFLYNYGFAHVAQALEPSGEFFISYAQLRPYISRRDLLARFIR